MVSERILARLAQVPGVRSLWNRFPVGSVELRVRHGIFPRPHYAYGVFSAAQLAKSLGLPGISVVEFGVAGGRGLRALEKISALVEQDTGVRINVVGFDSGTGMPDAIASSCTIPNGSSQDGTIRMSVFPKKSGIDTKPENSTGSPAAFLFKLPL